MKIRNLVLALFVTLAFGSTAIAGGKDDRICSPGWYKNNGLDTWINNCALTGAYSCSDLLSMLNANGKTYDKPGRVKNDAADYIVANLLGKEGETCEEVYD